MSASSSGSLRFPKNARGLSCGMLDWWFDADGKICCVRMDERKTASSATFDGGVRVKFEGVRVLKSGKTYVYAVADGHSVNINDVKLRGERYVSLYFDGKLIKEYNVHAEYYKHKYGSYPEIYDSVRLFFRRTAFASVALAVFAACFLAAALTAAGIINTLIAAGIFAAACAATSFVLFGAFAALRYAVLHARMKRYSIISSVKKHKKARRRTGRKR